MLDPFYVAVQHGESKSIGIVIERESGRARTEWISLEKARKKSDDLNRMARSKARVNTIRRKK